MKDRSQSSSESCFFNCDELLRECLNRGEDQIACRIQEQVPCLCKCTASS